jgi:hypothetical protein
MGSENVMQIFIIVSCFLNIYGNNICNTRGAPFSSLADCQVMAAKLNDVDQHRSVPVQNSCYKKTIPAWEPAQ